MRGGTGLIVAAFVVVLDIISAVVMAQELDWTGAWDTRWPNGGATLYFEQEGQVVRGTYPVLSGTIIADVRGSLLVGTWEDATGSGDLVFSMAPDGMTFMGRYGNGEWWTGERHAEMQPGGDLAADASSPEAAVRTFVVAGNDTRDNRTDRLGPALQVLDFSDLPPEQTDTADERLALGAQLFTILDQLTFRIWELPDPAPGQEEVVATLSQAGSGETYDLRIRYGVRANGAAGWFIVVPDPATMQADLRRLLEVSDGQLEAPDAHEQLRSPRDTIQTFLEQYHVWEQTGATDLLFRTLNLSEIVAAARDDEAPLRAQYLKQIMDRVGYVIWQEVPNYPDRQGPYTHFVHPEGRVELEAVGTEEGDRIWQFTPETLATVRPLYMALEDMPTDVGVATETRWTFLDFRHAIRGINRDLLHTVWGVEIWQWLALAILLAVSIPLSALIAWLLLRVVLRWRREPGALLSIKHRFVWPLQLLVVAAIGSTSLRFLGLPDQVDLPIRVATGVVFAVAGGWLAYNLIDKLADVARAASGRFQYRDEMLRSLIVAMLKVVVVIGAVLLLADVLAIPYQGVIAGLGIGGLAVALAARSTLENFIGGLTLLADKPVQVGDFCKFGDQIGTVESLGLRSVKIRSLDRTVVTIPNGEFVNLYLENYAKRDRILLKAVLQLRYETTPDQLRWVMTELRKLLIQHPRVLADPSRVRFVDFGAHSLDLEVFAYVETSDWGEFLAIREDIYLSFIGIVEASGTGFAFPSMVNYLARDTGIDAEKRATVEETIQQLREQNRLPFPEFDEDERQGMFNQRAYPAAGSPQSAAARVTTS